ncbi:hypothetical protein BH18THE1_BH18THE1_22360 [soil metagenome]
MEKSVKLPESFKLGIIITYAIVIALSIDSSKTILIPFYSIPGHVLFATVLFYGYFIIITGWVEFYLLLQRFEHQGRFVLRKLVIDIGILFLFYYIIVGGSNTDVGYLIPDVYLFITPVLYFLFTLKDMYGVRDYQDNMLIKYRNMSRNFLFISIIISLLYLSETYATGFQSFGALAF